ncbi:MAG: fibronectin type III domain-containing protein [Oscillospiraceae bacterium]|nr:fibronectin type III domain-containing protein [Oscillospiraceae bacterium]
MKFKKLLTGLIAFAVFACALPLTLLTSFAVSGELVIDLSEDNTSFISAAWSYNPATFTYTVTGDGVALIGTISDGENITISVASGKTVTVTSTTLTIESGATLTIADGTMFTVASNGIVINKGTIINKGAIVGVLLIQNQESGTIINRPEIETTSLPGVAVNASYDQTIVTNGGGTMAWSVSEGALPAGINLTGNKVMGTPTTAGIYNFTIAASNEAGIATRALSITVTANETPYVAVTNITGIPTTAVIGTPLTLSGTVEPATATNKTIVWTVKSAGATGATITDGNKLNTTAAGTVTITATITNGGTQTTPYTKDFTLTVSAATIKDITLTGITAPATFNAPVRNITLPAGTPFTAGPVSWTLNNNSALAANANFAASTIYTATVTLTPNTGFSFANQNEINAKIDTLTATVVKNTTGTVTVSYRFPATKAASQLPLAPQNFTAEPLNGQVRLSWSTPTNTGGSPITKYQISYGTTAGYTVNWLDMPSSGAGTTTYTVPNLINATEYTFEIRAFNRDNGGGVSSGIKKATPSGVATAPLNFNVSPGNGYVTLTWTPPSFIGGSYITRYEYSYGVKGGYTEYWQEVPFSGNSTTSHIVNYLDNGVEYTFEVRAVNANGDGITSGRKDAIPSTSAISAPLSFTVTPGDGAVILSWSPPQNTGGNTITKYQFSYGEINAAGTYTASWRDIPNSTADTRNHTVPALTNGKNYAFEVRAVSNSVNSGTSGVKITSPTALSGNTAAVESRKTDITNAANSNNGQTINITMTAGSTSISKEVLNIIKGKDVKLVLDFGTNGKITVNGKDVTDAIVNAGALNLNTQRQATTNTMLADYSIPKTAIDTRGKNVPVQQFKIGSGAVSAAANSVAVSGTATVNVGNTYAGQNALLCSYNAQTAKFEVVSGAAVGTNGEVTVNFKKTGDYVVIIQKTGDVTGTGKIDSADALEILRHVVGSTTLDSTQLYVGSARHDGTVGTNDALTILRFVVGTITKI